MPFHLYICYHCFYLLELLNCCAAYSAGSVCTGGLESKCRIYGEKQRRGGSQRTFSRISKEAVNDLHDFRRATCQHAAEHEFPERPPETRSATVTSVEEKRLHVPVMLVMIRAECIATGFSVTTEFRESLMSSECISVTQKRGCLNALVAEPARRLRSPHCEGIDLDI